MSAAMLEAVDAVLGAVLLDARNALPAVVAHCTPSDLLPGHADVLTAALELDARSMPVDTLTVLQELKRSGGFERIRHLGGEEYVIDLPARVVTIENVGYYAKQLRDAAQRRRIVTGAGRVLAAARDPHVEDAAVLEAIERELVSLLQPARANEGPQQLRRVLRDVRALVDERMAARAQGGNGVAGLSTSFGDLDALTTGMHPGELWIGAARPAMGKTSFGMGAAEHISRNVPTLVFSLEMSANGLGERLAARESGINLLRLRSGDLQIRDLCNLDEGLSRLSTRKLWLDQSSRTLPQIRSRARAWRARDGAGDDAFILVDYLQLIEGTRTDGNREREVAEVSRGMKLLAMELRCPVMVLSQLNRSLESRSDKRPMLSDLRESGAIEQDADVVAFIYRDEVYHPNTHDAGIAEVIIGKQRNGPLATVKLGWRASTVSFVDLGDER